MKKMLDDGDTTEMSDEMELTINRNVPKSTLVELQSPSDVEEVLVNDVKLTEKDHGALCN
ncbi:hypothetical protein [Marininema halotolerans]|uniref:Uncharacterized protein n=1 Tax=Marininema halotolerans TaxID=1155944 RepID=A0A1I6QK14_9BACL|nr:hypothetical protein [Marininema halotolerans]SFS52628.1 hypothetical protein SAMN05444972_103193 [Marininema halotolerans]